jgi:hypothetical protein
MNNTRHVAWFVNPAMIAEPELPRQDGEYFPASGSAPAAWQRAGGRITEDNLSSDARIPDRNEAAGGGAGSV